jgi:hypothetical protein
LSTNKTGKTGATHPNWVGCYGNSGAINELSAIIKMKKLPYIFGLTFLIIWINSFGQDNNLNALKQFAESYKPYTDSKQIAANLPNVPDKIKSSFPSLRKTNKKELEQYLTLIFLKLYRSHLECCHQSYEIRNSITNYKIDSLKDPLIYEYNLTTKNYKPNALIEFISSDIGYTWTKKNPSLLKYYPIKKEYDIIEQIEKNIDNGIFWENKN